MTAEERSACRGLLLGLVFWACVGVGLFYAVTEGMR